MRASASLRLIGLRSRSVLEALCAKKRALGVGMSFALEAVSKRKDLA